MTRYFAELHDSDTIEIRLPRARTVVLSSQADVTVTYAPDADNPFFVGYAHLRLPTPEAGMDDHGLQEYDVIRNEEKDEEGEEDE